MISLSCVLPLPREGQLLRHFVVRTTVRDQTTFRLYSAIKTYGLDPQHVAHVYRLPGLVSIFIVRCLPQAGVELLCADRFGVGLCGAIPEPYNWWSRMQNTGVDFEAVRAVARDFADLQESTMYGSPAIKLGKRLVACLAIHRSAEPASLVVRTDFEQRAAFLNDDPETFYVTDHYVKNPVVLVRLARVRHDQLRDLLAAARQCVLAQAERSQKTRLRGYKGHATRG
jgi:hypothetical protein